eukprot:Skav220199  [mRNA]  locus=scaffold1074:418919:421958:- [translate_table: standard]
MGHSQERAVERSESSQNMNQERLELEKKMGEIAKPHISTRIQDDSIWRNTLRYVALQQKLHFQSLEMHIWGRNGWVQGSLAVSKSATLKSLVLQLEGAVPEAFILMHSSRIRRWFLTFLATHPAVTLLHCDLHVTAAKRAKIFMDCVLGSLAFVAIFFSVDGSTVAARSPEDCPVQQGTVGWYTFVTLFSILLNFIPRSLMYYLAWRDFEQQIAGVPSVKQFLRKRCCWDVEFWLVAISLSGLHLLVITAFLANLGEVDEWKCMVSFMVVMLRKFLIVPLVACIFSGLVSEITAIARPKLLSEPPRKLGMDLGCRQSVNTKTDASDAGAEARSVWEKKVQELALRGITVEQLLDFYADLQQQMPHFDPDLSTTHDVVRQVVIPGSLQMKSSGSKLSVTVQCEEARLSHDLRRCSVWAVSAVKDGAWMDGMDGVSKPWKGGGMEELEGPSWQAADTIFIAGMGPVAVSARAGSQNSREELALAVHDFECAGVAFLEDADAANPTDLIGYAYATAINAGVPRLAQKMVTHNWGNKFAHLIGAVFADALQQETYDGIVALLKTKDFDTLYGMLEEKNQLGVPYWVCAFSVNQHAGICARAPATDSQGHPIQTCICSTEKHFSGDLSDAWHSIHGWSHAHE